MQVHTHTFKPADPRDLTDAMWRSLRWTMARAWGPSPEMDLERCAGCHEVRVQLRWPHTRRTVNFGPCEPFAPVTSAKSAATAA